MSDKKTVRFADVKPTRRAAHGKRLPPEKNLDRTRPIVYQPPLGVASVHISPQEPALERQQPDGGNLTNNQETTYQNQQNHSPINKSNKAETHCAETRPIFQRVNHRKLNKSDCQNCNNCKGHLADVEPSHEISDFSSEDFDNLKNNSDVLADECSDPEDEVPPYYRRRVPSPLPPGQFRDQRTKQLFTREAYCPEGINPCEVRTFQVELPLEPDNSRILTFHPGRTTPVTNFADFEKHNRERRKRSAGSQQSRNRDSGLGSQDSLATRPHVSELNKKTQISPGNLSGQNSDTTMAAAISVPNAVARLQERNDMAELNDRLAHYVMEVKHLREQAHRVDSTAFLESIKILEDGLHNLKAMYEQELDKARRYADDISRSKNHYAMQVEKHQNGLQELENRLSDEMEKNRKAQDDMNMMHRALAEKDRQMEDIKNDMKNPLEELEQLRRQNADLLRETTNLKQKNAAENYQRNEAEDRTDHFQQKMNFMETVHKQESDDLNERLAVAQDNILTLEQRVRDLTRPDNLLEELVSRVRQSANQEMTMFKEESEEIFQRTVTALKARIDEDARNLEDLTSRNVQLTSEHGELLAKLRACEGQIGSLDHQKRSLEDILYNERQHARHHITNLERKLQDLSDLLFLKLRELNAARDAQVPLKSEVEALRVLLQEEEQRLRTLPEITSEAAGGIPRSLHPLTAPLPTAPSASMTPLTPAAYAGGVNNPNHTNTARRHPTSPQHLTPLGPVRARSAPVTHAKLNLVPTTLGHGKDYFDQMFNDLKRDLSRTREAFPSGPASSGSSPFDRPHNPEPGISAPERPYSSMTHDYNTSSSSATGPLRILEVHPDGKYVRLVNTATTKEEEFGNFLLQQNVGGHPVAVYRFPPRLRFPSNATITVWAGSNDHTMHQPPTDFVFKEQTKWGTGPECTTILCRPTGQAIAWTTAAHRFTKDAFDQVSLNMDDGRKSAMKGQEELTELNLDMNGPRETHTAYLKREKEQPPILSAQKHPHGSAPNTPTHPSTGHSRPYTYGNDNSSVNRQSRSQSTRPDPIAGAPYAGASAQRMGSASLRKQSGTIKGNGTIANKAEEFVYPGTATSRPPSSFQKPKDRFVTGLQQIQSQHNEDFIPPMPRPPLFSAW